MSIDHRYFRNELCQIKYQRFTPSGCKDKGIKQFVLVIKTVVFQVFSFVGNPVVPTRLVQNIFIPGSTVYWTTWFYCILDYIVLLYTRLHGSTVYQTKQFQLYLFRIYLILVLLYTGLCSSNYTCLEYLFSWFFCILDYIVPTKRVQNIITPGSTVNQTIQFQLYLFRIYLLLVLLYTGLYSSNYTCLEYNYSWFYCILDYIVPTILVQNIFTPGSTVYQTIQFQLYQFRISFFLVLLYT